MWSCKTRHALWSNSRPSRSLHQKLRCLRPFSRLESSINLCGVLHDRRRAAQGTSAGNI